LGLKKKEVWFLPFLAFALVMGVWGGLLRIGWDLPPLLQNLPIVHGPVMVSGVLGTLIALERSFAVGKSWTYFVPALCGAGTILFLLKGGGSEGSILIFLGSIGMVGIFLWMSYRYPLLHTFAMAQGSLFFFFGNLLWLLGKPVSDLLPFWVGFLLFTILGERLELGRILQISRIGKGFFLGGMILYTAGLLSYLFSRRWLFPLCGGALIFFSLWLFFYDIPRKTVQRTGITRFIAIGLLAGYFWLFVGGVFWWIFPGISAGPLYDGVVHTVLVGFVFSMIFAHGPIIFPAFTGMKVVYFSTFYVPLFLLHGSLLVRVWGDLLGMERLRQWGGLLNGVAIGVFFLHLIFSIWRGRRAEINPMVH